jgi:L-gulonate 3-dehydrogenase
MKKVTVFGSGIVGRCWASLFARGGLKVWLYDIKNITEAVQDVRKNKLPLLESFNMLNGKKAHQLEKLIFGTSSLEEALSETDYIQECVPEDIEIKKKVHSIISSNLSLTSNAIIGSSSSNLSSSLFACPKQVSKTLIVHPINPPFAIPLVELVPSEKTLPDVVLKTKRLMELIGLSPVILKKEIDGFAVNRLQYALLAEAYRLVEDKILTPEDVDTVVKKGLGLRWSFMGPFETIDLNANGIKDYCKKFSSSIERVVSTQDNNRKWKENVFVTMEKSMRSKVPLSELKQRIKWRDFRLMELASHQSKMDKKLWNQI